MLRLYLTLLTWGSITVLKALLPYSQRRKLMCPIPKGLSAWLPFPRTSCRVCFDTSLGTMAFKSHKHLRKGTKGRKSYCERQWLLLTRQETSWGLHTEKVITPHHPLPSNFQKKRLYLSLSLGLPSCISPLLSSRPSRTSTGVTESLAQTDGRLYHSFSL